MTVELQHRDIIGRVKRSSELLPGSKVLIQSETLVQPRVTVEVLSSDEVFVSTSIRGEERCGEIFTAKKIDRARLFPNRPAILPSPITLSWRPNGS